MPSNLAIEKAAQAWCTEKTKPKHIEMDIDLVEAFADILDVIWNEPWLGNATNEQLLDELRARFEVDGKLHYATTKWKDAENNKI